MVIAFGREICSHLGSAECREWLVTNGIGGYASGTLAGLLTRRYHGLLIAALRPPLERTLLLAKLDETASYNGRFYPLACNRWASGVVEPHGYKHIQKFYLEGTAPVWHFACGNALLEKRIWMQQGENTTYIRYHLQRGSKPLKLVIKALVNYRDYHHNTHADNWQVNIAPLDTGVSVKAYPEAIPLYLLVPDADSENFRVSMPPANWYYGFDLPVERLRGLNDYEDHLHAVTFHVTLEPGQSVTVIATTETHPNLNQQSAWQQRWDYEQSLLQRYQEVNPSPSPTPEWMQQLVLAADQFIVSRPLPEVPNGKTIIAGYHWFSDWGRDTMISLPGLTLVTGKYEIARSILHTFARYIDQGMLPNQFPEAGTTPAYNTVDAALWYFEALRAYHEVTQDDQLLRELFPSLVQIIQAYQQGTRYNIHLDPEDGLIYAGELGVQLTWMDAKVGNWVVTPRIGKPIEINALWYHGLQIMIKFAQRLGEPFETYQTLATQTAQGFRRYWHEASGYCYDVLDTPTGDDLSLRPNQIFAISLPPRGIYEYEPLLTPEQRCRVVDICAQSLLTSYGLRSLDPDDERYQGEYGGNQLQRDGAYHQGTVWGWLLGPFAIAYWRAYGDAITAREFLEPMADHLSAHGVGSLSEIFEGNAPMRPRGCIAQAWTVAEVLRAWQQLTVNG